MKRKLSRRRFLTGTAAFAGAGLVGALGRTLQDLLIGSREGLPAALAEGSIARATTTSAVLEQTNIDPKDFVGLFSELQGNILRDHHRDYAIHLFLRFKGSPENVKKWIRAFARTYVTSAAQEEEKGQATQRLFGSLLLSADGYWYLGMPLGPNMPGDISFRSGMKARQEQDNPSQPWEADFLEEIHALVLLAHNDEKALDEAAVKIEDEVRTVAEIVTRQEGFGLTRDQDYPREPFGYRDEISQPLFLNDQIEQVPDRDEWDPSANLSLVLVKDPNGKTEDSYGSYLVYRKLAQDVDGFHQKVRELADKLGVDEDLAGALVMGRFKDGTPVLLSDSPEGNPTNNFNYGQDINGAKCPFQSHLRKANPRGDTPTRLEVEKSHRIVRRGVIFDARDRGGEVGLLFLCYQSNVSQQFEFIQDSWSSQNHFVRQGVGQDSVAGLGKQLENSQTWSKEWGKEDAQTIKFNFSNYVALKGGEYFFAPSISFLKAI